MLAWLVTGMQPGWTGFARCGNPSPSGIRWKYTLATRLQCGQVFRQRAGRLVRCGDHLVSAVRVAVADGGAPTGPRLIEDPQGEHGRGLLIVRSLSCRLGVCGDERGRLVWAEVAWTGDGNGAPGLLPVGYEAAVRADEAALVQRFAGVPVWFGRSTLQWWAMLRPARGRRLLAARSARELAEVLDRALGRFCRPGWLGGDGPGAARASGGVGVPTVPVPPRGPAMWRIPGLGARPC